MISVIQTKKKHILFQCPLPICSNTKTNLITFFIITTQNMLDASHTQSLQKPKIRLTWSTSVPGLLLWCLSINLPSEDMVLDWYFRKTEHTIKSKITLSQLKLNVVCWTNFLQTSKAVLWWSRSEMHIQFIPNTNNNTTYSHNIDMKARCL